jgi:hypothetical protein
MTSFGPCSVTTSTPSPGPVLVVKPMSAVSPVRPKYRHPRLVSRDGGYALTMPNAQHDWFFLGFWQNRHEKATHHIMACSLLFSSTTFVLLFTVYGLGVAFAIGFSFLLGILSYFFVKGEAENYFVAGKSLPMWIVAMTLGAQSVDSNTLLGNVDLAFRGHVRVLVGTLFVRSFSRRMPHDGAIISHHLTHTTTMMTT